jgi:hypothetical protein
MPAQRLAPTPPAGPFRSSSGTSRSAGLATDGEAHLVMLVRDRISGAHRVVKVYGAAVRPDPALFERLHRADPEHLVQLHGWGEHTDEWNVSRCWEILEYVPGGSLAT